MGSTDGDQLSKKFPIGEPVQGTVYALANHGALIRLEGEVTGIIRNRELAWDRDVAHPREVLALYQPVAARVIGVDAERQRLELSLRMMERDPWQGIAERYPLDSVVRGRVERLVPYGAFVSLEPGVEGLVHIREVLPEPPKRVGDVLWVGDTVEAVVTELDVRRRRLALSVRLRLARPAYTAVAGPGGRAGLGAATGGTPVPKAAADRLRLTGEGQPEAMIERADEVAWCQANDLVQRILIVDDDASLRTSLARLLKRLGYQVDAAESGERAVALCHGQRYDLVLMDLSLPGISGLDAAKRIFEREPGMPLVMMTGVDWLDRRAAIIEQAQQLGARAALTKPLDLSRLSALIKEINAGNELQSLAMEPAAEAMPPPFLREGAAPALLNLDRAPKTLKQIVNDLRCNTGADAAVVFHVEPATNQVAIVAHSGTPLSQSEAMMYTLLNSPVADVIFGRDRLYEQDTSRNPFRFRYLSPMLAFRSCIGVPVEALGQTQHGLFLFHKDAQHFTRGHVRLAIAAAHQVGAAIAHAEAERAIQASQHLMLAGQIGAVLVHELNNKITSVQQEASLLKLNYDRLANSPSPEQAATLHDEIGEVVTNLLGYSKDLRDLARLYLNLRRVERYEVVNVNEILRQAIRLLEPLAREYRIQMRSCFAEDIPATMTIGSRLEQVFINLILNAIQQVNQFKGTGEVAICTAFEPGDESFPLKIRFVDNGPGVHGQHLDKVFLMGFTTRPDGTGLGLFVSQRLIESLGGRIEIQDNVLLVGSIFRIDLPLVVPSSEERVPWTSRSKLTS